MRDELLGHYESELVFLRKMGADFARKYPKVAARLLLDEEKIEDPHVERIIEAFAFLAGRINLKLADELPEITESFLNVLYPHYLNPIPSMAITQFLFGTTNDKLTSIQSIAKGTKLFSRPVDGSPCRFQTCYETPLAPLEVIGAALESDAPQDAQGRLSECRIRINLRTFGKAQLAELKASDPERPLEFLRFYLDGDPQLTFPLYELIFNHCTKVEIVAKEEPVGQSLAATITNFQYKLPDPVVLGPDVIKQVGFSEKEAVLPFSKRSFPGYRLLTEYFSFPYKFLFFDVTDLASASERKFGSHFDVVIHLKNVTPPKSPVTQETFKLGCSPIVNLFSETAEPIYLSQQKYEYQVFPDVHRQNATEVYSIDEVFTTDPRTNNVKTFSPFYSVKHSYENKAERVFWYASRRASQRLNDQGSEVFLSLVDTNFDPRTPADEVIIVKATCSNRDLPARLPFGGKEGDFEIEGAALVSRIRCLTKPTETLRPPMRRALQWRLISHLNLNILSLLENESGEPEALKEILQLYNYSDSTVIEKQINGIVGVSCRKVVRQIGDRIGAGFVRGLETTIEFDEEQYIGGGLFLLASVLERFLSLYVTVNSFNQLVIRTKQREAEVKRWSPRAGEQSLL